MRNKKVGVLLPVFSLPNTGPIGDFGAAYRFIDILTKHGITYWQILPLNPVDPAHDYSPYAGLSSFAISELYFGITDEREYSTSRVNYAQALELKQAALKKAYRHFQPTPDFADFQEKEKFWLPSYAHDDYAVFVQYILFSRWRSLKEYANARGVQIIGDLPFFAAFNSADTQNWPQYFKLSTAGVPPDYFNPAGQVWNLPLYDWDALQKDDFIWWRERVRAALAKYDLVRLDHFRGLDACYEISAGAADGSDGRWVQTPGRELLTVLQKDFPDLPLIAEDLGVITPDVIKLRGDFNLPGTRVGLLDFVDYSRLKGNSEHNIRQIPENCVLYSTTHDFNTVSGWYAEADRETREYFRREIGSNKPQDYLRYWLNANAHTVVFPVQDILGLGSDARINFPGTAGKQNWTWRLKMEELVNLDRDFADLVPDE